MDGIRSTERIVETVRAASPDLICFQEIHKRLPWSGMEDQPHRLSRLLDYSFTFHRLLNIGIGGYGIAIASRWKPLRTRKHRLPSVKEQRGLLEVGFSEEAMGVPFSLFCTHWGLTEGERLKQAQRCVEIINACSQPALLCGDLNAEVSSNEVVTLYTKGFLADAGAKQAQATFPSDHPSERIDYIFHSQEWCVDGFEVVSTQASDHLPLFADVSCETL